MDALNGFRQYDAILLAGEGESSYKVLHQHKAFLRLQGKCIVTHVIETLQRVNSIRAIYVVGAKETLGETLVQDGVNLVEPKPIHLLPQRENLYQNIWHTFLATLPADHDPETLETGPYRDRAALIVPCDAPLMSPFEVEYFINLSDPDHYDHVMGITPEASLEPFYPEGGKPGIRMAYLHLKEGNYRINNLHLVKPIRIGNRHYIEKMYQYRYQRNIRNVVPFALKLFWKDKYKGYHYYLGLILSLLFSNLNCPSLVRYFKSWVPKKGLEEWISQGLATRFKSLVVPYPGAALDIDNESDFNAMNIRFVEWKAYLKQLEAGPAPAAGLAQVSAQSRVPLGYSQLTKT